MTFKTLQKLMGPMLALGLVANAVISLAVVAGGIVLIVKSVPHIVTLLGW